MLLYSDYLPLIHNFDIEFFLLQFIELKHSYSQVHALGPPFYYHVSAEFNDIIHDRYSMVYSYWRSQVGKGNGSTDK